MRIVYNMFGIPDRLDCTYNAVLVATTGGLASGTGTLQRDYAPLLDKPMWCLVVVSAPTTGTAWIYTLQCLA